MPSDWKIRSWPRCIAHVFLSHCAENRKNLVLPIFERLKQRQIIPWIDRHHYPIGREPSEALRDAILQCRHLVYFVTPEFLRQGRGWTGAERAFGSTIQHNLRYGAYEVCHIELPLFFVEPDDETFLRSAWRGLIDKGTFYANSAAPGEDPVLWASNQISAFVSQEERWAVDIGENIEQDPEMKDYFSVDNNLKRRIIAADPPPISRSSD